MVERHNTQQSGECINIAVQEKHMIPSNLLAQTLWYVATHKLFAICIFHSICQGSGVVFMSSLSLHILVYVLLSFKIKHFIVCEKWQRSTCCTTKAYSIQNEVTQLFVSQSVFEISTMIPDNIFLFRIWHNNKSET